MIFKARGECSTITPLKITYTHLLQTSKEFDETMENNPAIAMSF